jgi:hypothetical protein
VAVGCSFARGEELGNVSQICVRTSFKVKRQDILSPPERPTIGLSGGIMLHSGQLYVRRRYECLVARDHHSRSVMI